LGSCRRQEHGDEAKLLAGGQSLMPVLAMRLAMPTQLVDLDRVDELRGIDRVNEHVRIGAMTRHADLPRNDAVAERVPLLARAVPLVGHIAIRNRGTIGGALAHADPAAEYPAVCVALGATMEIVGPNGTRDVAADDFFDSTFTTALEPDELLRAIRLPLAQARSGSAILEVARRHGDFALAGVACTVQLGADSRISNAAVVLFGVAGRPWRAEEAERAVVGQPADVDVDVVAANRALDGLEPPSSIHASADYLRHVSGVLIARALRAALKEATGG
jgi:carbon-monoxide dehydrogenase medium subunit